MELGFFRSLIYGFLTGLTEILPVSSRAHGQLLLKIFGQDEETVFLLLIHLGILGALYRASAGTVTKIVRAIALTRIPKRKRTRPLDVRSLMDFRLFRTISIPALIGYLFYGRLHTFDSNLILLSVLVMLNGVILYAPQFFPGGNKDSRNMSRIDGLLIGSAMGLSVLPGISAVGAGISAASLCSVDKKYALNQVLLVEMTVMVCLIIQDIIALLAGGVGAFTFRSLLACFAGAAAAYLGCSLGVRAMRKLFIDSSMQMFAFYCWGMASLVFFLNLMA